MEPEQHVYRVGPWRSRLLYGAWAAFTIPLTAVGLLAESGPLLVAGLIASAITLPIFTWSLRRARLTLTPEGIEMRQAGATLRTSWENVEEIRLVRGAEGFVTRAPIGGTGAARYATTSRVRLRGVPMYDEDRRGLIAARRFIPIEPFAHWLRHGDLHQVLSRYVPALVRQAEAAAMAGVSRPRQRSTAPIAGATIALLAAGVGVLGAAAGMESGMIRIVAAVMVLALAVMALRNGLSAAEMFRARRIGGGLFWSRFAVLQTLLMLALLPYVVK